MEIQNIIDELLCIGLEAEVFNEKDVGNKKTLKRHIFALYELQKCLHIGDIEISRKVIKKFINDCGTYYEISRCYPILSDTLIDEAVLGEGSKKVNQMIKEMFNDLVTETKKIFINKRKIEDLLYVLWKLLKVYLGKHDMYKIWKEESVPELWALNAVASSMDDEMRKKYLHEERYKNYISRKIYIKVEEDSKIKEKVYCPICDEELFVQRSDDWTTLYEVACEKCGFRRKIYYD